MIAPMSKSKMETGFEPGDSANLPRMDCVMVAAYLVTLPKHDWSAKTSRSTEECYDDDAIGYVQLCRDVGLCILKARVCPKPQAYVNVTLILNEMKMNPTSDTESSIGENLGWQKYFAAEEQKDN